VSARTTDNAKTSTTGFALSSLFKPETLAGSISVQTVATSLARCVGFLRGVLLLWLLAPTEYGTFHIALTAVNVLMPVLSLGLTSGIKRYAPAHEAEGNLSAFVRRSFTLTLVVAGAGTVLLLLLAPAISRLLPAAGMGGDVASWLETVESHQVINLIRLASGCILSLVIYHAVSDLMTGLRMFRAVGAMDVASVVLFSVAAVAAPVVGFDSANTVLACYGLANTAVALAVVGPLRHALKNHTHGPTSAEKRAPRKSKLLRFSLGMAGGAVMWHILQQYAFWHFAAIEGPERAGPFYAARLFAQLVLWGSVALTSALSAHVTGVWETTGRDEAIRHFESGCKAGLLVVLAGAAALSLARPWLFALYPTQYVVGAACFNAMLVSYAMFSAFGFVAIRFHLEERSILAFWATFVGVFVTIALGFWLLGTAGSAPGALGSEMITRASWVIAGGATAAVIAGIFILGLTRHSLTRATLVLVAGLASLGFGWTYSVPLLLVFAVASMTNIGPLSPTDRKIIAEWVRDR
jgi:O-antigen/teichoic acid export membrane protein